MTYQTAGQERPLRNAEDHRISRLSYAWITAGLRHGVIWGECTKVMKTAAQSQSAHWLSAIPNHAIFAFASVLSAIWTLRSKICRPSQPRTRLPA